MTRSTLRSAAVAAVAAFAAVMASSPASASASTPDAATYGQHVVECTQSMPFDQQHNPGMHRGFSMWDPDHTC